MPSLPLHPLPRRGEVLREQLRTVGQSLRREALLAGGTLGAFTTYVAALQWNGLHRMGELSLVPAALFPAVLLSLFVALAVWKAEDPARRAYHWSMPVDHARHALTKSLSGWAWLMAAISVYFLWVAGMAVFTGGDLGWEKSWNGYRYGPNPIPLWRWLVPVGGATVLYLFGTALALASRHPWRWLAGGVVGYVFLQAWRGVAHGVTPLHDLLRWLWEGRLGLRTVLTGTSIGWRQNPYIEFPYQVYPDLPGWAMATTLWLAAAGGAAVLAARFQPRG